MKKITGITWLTLLVVALTVPAFAWGPGGRGDGMRNHRNWDNRSSKLTPEQQKQMKELHKKFRDKTADARNEMMKKYIDLRAIINKDKPDINKAEAVQKEISELQAKIAQDRVEFIIEAKKIDPNMHFGWGFRMGGRMMGMHHRMMGRGGYGF